VLLLKALNSKVYFKKFINTSLFNYDELNVIFNQAKNLEQLNFRIINNNASYAIPNDKLLEIKDENVTYIVEDAKDIKPTFKSFRDVFVEKFTDLRSSVNWDVHIFASRDKGESSFQPHKDKASNVIVQCEGTCRWTVDNQTYELEQGDIIYIPIGVEHHCVPLSRRLSLSFPFWFE